MTIAAVCAAIDALSKENQTLRTKVATLANERDTARAAANYRPHP